MPSFAVDRMRPDDRPAVDDYLAGDSEASLFHWPVWHSILQASYGHRCDYWVARSGPSIAGVFPVTRMRYPVLGTKLIAGPYQFHSGYPLGRDLSVRAALIERAVSEAASQRARYLEIRHHSAVPSLEELGFVLVDPQLELTTVALPGLTLSRIRRNHRRNIRSATERGVAVTEGETLEDLRRFRRMYLEQSRALGAPQAGWRLFESLHRLGRPYYRLLLAWYEERCIGGLLALDDGRNVFARYAAYGSEEAMRLHVGHMLYWRALSDASERGCETYNCGISWRGDPGLIHWKEGWGGTTSPAFVYVRPLRGEAPVAGGYFEHYRLAKAVWRRLPLPVVDRLGHLVTRWIG